MPISRDFRTTVKARVERDPAFRAALLTEVVDLFLGGDVQTGKAMLRDYINATIGFAELAERTGTPEKSLMRMVSKSGNPRADNLFAILSALQVATGVQIEVRAAA
ncbi:MAG: transcriptional regulator [Devosia nanyangense]|uniref:Transcriptional regulator n=1 Tax=Devosia nanyangense TaxID=1228055 RepID=A0A933NWN1_9HYPH|nr:transcriptional regulator [Devosia nanyangense]